jgi:basic amino acid/polyamine antiporter, APA family
MNGVISGATVAVGFAGYFTQLVPLPTLIASLAVIGLLFLINVTGIRESSTINIIFTIIETGGLFFVIFSALSHFGSADYMKLFERGINGFFTGAALAFYAFIGFEEIVKLAEETKNPQKNIPRALFTACVIVMIMYTIVTLAAISAKSAEQLAVSKSTLADIVSSEYGRTGALIISVIALFSTSNTILSNMLGSSRVLLNVAKEKKKLSKLAYVSPKRKTPVAALILIGIAMALFALIDNIETIAMIANLFIFTTFLLVNIAVIVLRKKDKDLERPFFIPFNIKNVPVFSLIAILLVLFLLGYNVYGLLSGKSAGS